MLDLIKSLEAYGFREISQVANTLKSIVFRAVHPRYGKVAVKIPKLVETLSEEDIARFKREYETFKRLSHPHLAIALDLILLNDSIPALIVEWCPQTLRQKLKSSGRLDLEESLLIAQKMLKALTYIHSQGFVHGDLKPENILFTEDGEPKVSDLETSRVAIQKEISEKLTPLYAAPEQLKGEISDKTDVYQTALIIYEMITGRLANPLFGEPPGDVKP
jgi:serine/threonine protein kinase